MQVIKVTSFVNGMSRLWRADLYDENGEHITTVVGSLALMGSSQRRVINYCKREHPDVPVVVED